MAKRSDLGRVLFKGDTFTSKSGGRLQVLVQLNERAFRRLFKQNKTLRIYRVSAIPKGGIGAREFHRKRSEIITVDRGEVRLLLEDTQGRRKTVDLREGMTYGLIEPFVLHTYVALTDHASLHVVANTLYVHEKPSTHDVYSETEFRRLRSARLRKGSSP